MMTESKVLLISILPNSHRNMSCLALVSTLNERGVETDLLFLPKRDEYRAEQVQEFVSKKGYAVVGLSVMTNGFEFAKSLTAHIQQCGCRPHVIWGGIHPTLMPEECLEYADSVFVGDAEEGLPRFVESIINQEDYSCLPGIGTTAGNGGVVVNPPEQRCDLNSLPFNRYDWARFYVQDADGLRPFGRSEYARYSNYDGQDYTMMTSRSCPFSCSYCCNEFLNRLYGKRTARRRSVDLVIQEIQCARETIGSIEFINFIDDQFLVSRTWHKAFVERYKSEIGLPFIVRLAPGTFKRDEVKELRDAGLRFVQIGIQSGCAETHRDIFNRRFDREAVLESSRIFNELGIHPFYDVIIQNELEDDSEREQTIQLLLELERPFSLTPYALTPYPRTRLEEIYKERNVAPIRDPYEGGYADYNEEDFYYQLACVIPFTPPNTSRFFHRESGNPSVRRFLRQSYQRTIDQRQVRPTAWLTPRSQDATHPSSARHS